MTCNGSHGSLSLVMHHEHSPQPAGESVLRKPDRPLLLRLYASPLLVEIVRRIGYRAWERDDACDQLLTQRNVSLTFAGDRLDADQKVAKLLELAA